MTLLPDAPAMIDRAQLLAAIARDKPARDEAVAAIVGLLHRAWHSARLEALLNDAADAELPTLADYINEEILRDVEKGIVSALRAATTFEHLTVRGRLKLARRGEDRRRGTAARTCIRLLRGDVVHGKTPIRIASKEFVLLACLAGRACPTDREELVDALWPHMRPSDAFGTLRVYVTKLRKRIGAPNIIVAQNNRYRLDANVTTDIAEIGSLILRAERHCDRETAAELVAAGDALLSGLPTFLADYPVSSRIAFEVDALIERTSLLLDRLCSEGSAEVALLLSPVRAALGSELTV